MCCVLEWTGKWNWK